MKIQPGIYQEREGNQRWEVVTIIGDMVGYRMVSKKKLRYARIDHFKKMVRGVAENAG